VSEARPTLRVLQVHTRYRLPGGEDQVVEAERRLLKDAGLDVQQVVFDNAAMRESRSLFGDLGLAAAAIWSRSAEDRVKEAIVAHRPQVIHVHNTFPAASPSVYAAAAAHGVPVLQTLHNYRFVCPSATVFRDGHACTDCVGRPVPWPAVVHACVRGSRSQSAVAAATLTLHRARGTFAHDITGYVALTAFQRQLLIRGGLPARRIRVISNFLEPDPGTGPEERRGITYVGRVAPEKGIACLLDAASMLPGVIQIIGDGPLGSLAAAADAAGHVAYAGSLPSSSVAAALRRSIAFVLPSLWFEGFPLVLLEAYATGTPVIASRIGSLGELVEEGFSGLLAEPNDAADLADRIRWAVDHPSQMREMGVNARHLYETRFRGEGHLAALLAAYAWVGGGDSTEGSM
jgi:glycosyltransferase involved in cell wall biosynthesis